MARSARCFAEASFPVQTTCAAGSDCGVTGGMVFSNHKPTCSLIEPQCSWTSGVNVAHQSAPRAPPRRQASVTHDEIVSGLAKRWSGTAWAAVAQAAWPAVARAEGRSSDSAGLLRNAIRQVELAGQPTDAARCAGSLEALRASPSVSWVAASRGWPAAP
jgi:hypothetical protein